MTCAATKGNGERCTQSNTYIAGPDRVEVCGQHAKAYDPATVTFDSAAYRRRHSVRVPRGYGKEKS